MGNKIRNIPKRVLEYWNKFSVKQKALIISIGAVVLLTFTILGYALTRPNMVTLITAESTTESAQVKGLLEGDAIPYQISDNGLVISVNKKDLANANILLGSNNIPTDQYSIDNVFSGGFSTTEADKTKKYNLYLEEKIKSDIETMEAVKTAAVQLSIPENDGTIIAEEKDTYASIMLTLNNELDDGAALGLAKYISTAVGNTGTDSVLIIDSNGNVLFSGETESSISGNASSQLKVQTEAENLLKGEIKNVMLGTNVYDNVEVAPNLVLNFDVINETEHIYTPAEGQDQGLLSHEDIYESETIGGTAGTPGTDANDDTTYVIEENAGSSSTVTEESRDYLPNEKITDTKYAPGAIKYDESSVSIVATTYVVYSEAKLQEQGLLDGITFDEFMTQNEEKVKTEVDEDFYDMVSKATGIAVENISIVAYQVPFFQEAEVEERTITDYLLIALVILILALLGFVVYKSSRPLETTEAEPELSVEALLATTKENQELEEIDFNDKSETRIAIEKFVDENPEAVASLLRNWLDEEWE